MTAKEAASLAGCSPKTIYVLIAKGHLRGEKHEEGANGGRHGFTWDIQESEDQIREAVRLFAPKSAQLKQGLVKSSARKSTARDLWSVKQLGRELKKVPTTIYKFLNANPKLERFRTSEGVMLPKATVDKIREVYHADQYKAVRAGATDQPPVRGSVESRLHGLEIKMAHLSRQVTQLVKDLGGN